MYGYHAKNIAPHLSSVDRMSTRELLRLSGMFFTLTVVMAAADSMDNLIIAHTAGLHDVATYAVPAKLFAQVGVFLGLVNVPLWTFHGEALARGDVAWVRRATGRMTVISILIAVIPSIVIVCFGDFICSTLFGVTAGANRWLLAGLALWWVILATISPRFMVQNAVGVVRPQLIGFSLYLVLSVVAKWYCTKWFGITVLPYIGVATYLLTVLPTALYGYRRALLTHGEKK
jgi:O-antigen/teichoic acid export membrane protein